MVQPLTGVRVLDLSHTAAGPYCSQMLADFGAEVIKVEIPNRGDALRAWGPPFFADEGVYFLGLNRNKKSFTLNLKHEKGKEIFRELLKNSDVLLENFRPGTLEKLGFTYETLHSINPKVIICRISGYGQSGPYWERAGYDILAQGESGLMSITGTEDRPPGAKLGVAIVDLGTGMYAAQGILLALLAREKTGKGQLIDVALFDSAVSWMLQPAMAYMVSGKLPKRLGTIHPVAAPYQAFKTKDMYISIGCGNQNHWEKLCEIIDRKDLLDDSRFKAGSDRVVNREALSTILDKIFETKTGEEWLKLLMDARLPCAPVNTVDRLVKDPHVLHREMIVEVDHPVGGKMKMMGNPIKLSDTPGEVKTAPPILGQNTEEVLQELGYSAEDIKKLKDEGVV